MRFYTGQHRYYCGIDLHARRMYIGVLDAEGQVRLHRNGPATPEHFLATIAAYREDLVVAVEGIFTWYWVADLCAREGIAFVLGHALYMKAIHGGKAKNDKIDAHKIAVLLRGGMLPMAYVYPREMRATRDLLRRRCHFMRKRAELLTHTQNTATQYLLPAFDKKLAYKATRTDVAERFADPEARKSIETNLALLDQYDRLLTDLELHLTRSAKVHDVNAFYRLRSVPGIGKILALVLLYEIHDIHRFPRVQDFVSFRVLLPPREVRQAVRRQALRVLRHEDRQRPSEVGLLRSRRAVPAREPCRATIPDAPRHQAWQGHGPHDPRPQAGARDLLHAPPRARVRSEHVLPRPQPRGAGAGHRGPRRRNPGAGGSPGRAPGPGPSARWSRRSACRGHDGHHDPGRLNPLEGHG